MLGIYFLEGTPRSGETSFIKYLTNQLQMLGKKVLQVTTIGATTFRFSYKTSTIHKYFRVPI